MRHFILYSRTGRTDGKFPNLREGGRLDLVYQCAAAAMFLSHGIRKDAVLSVVLTGPPRPPKVLRIDGRTLHDVRFDEATWTDILRNVLSGGDHPGMTLSDGSFQALVKASRELYVLEESGQDICDTAIGGDPVFVLGDQVGLPKKEEGFALRTGKRISLGKTRYTAAGCVQIVNHWLDRKENFISPMVDMGYCPP